MRLSRFFLGVLVVRGLAEVRRVHTFAGSGDGGGCCVNVGHGFVDVVVRTDSDGM